MAKEKNNQDIQKNYLELQLLVNQISQIQQQIVSIQTQLNEIKNLKDSLEKLNKVKLNTEIYVPLGLNIFTKAKLVNNDEFLVAVGNDILVEKSLEETTELLSKQIVEVEKIILELETQLNALDANAQEIQTNIVNLSNKQ